MFRFYILLAILSYQCAAKGSICGEQILPPGTFYRYRVRTYHWFAGTQSNDWVVGCYYPSAASAEFEVRATCDFYFDADNGCFLETTLSLDPPKIVAPLVTVPPPPPVTIPPRPKHWAGLPPAEGGCYQRFDNFVDVDCGRLGQDECIRNFGGESGCGWKNPPVPPGPPYAVFIINEDKNLYCINGRENEMSSKVVGRPKWWEGFGAIADGYGKLFVAEQFLYTADRSTGATNRLTEANWKNSTAMAFAGGDLFIVQVGALHAVDHETGTYKVLGDVGTWKGHVSMTGEEGNLYMIRDEKFWRVDPATGQYTQLGSPTWHEPAYLAMAGSNLYALENKGFQIIDKKTGSYKVVGGLHDAFSKVTAFGAGGTAGDEYAFAIASERLLRIKVSDGSFAEVGGWWRGRNVLTVVPNLTC